MNEEFVYDGGTVEPGSTEHIEFSVTETYMGETVDVPVSVINGEENGKTVFLTAAIHGDELNGIEVVRSVAREWNHGKISGTLVCMPVVNVLGFMSQERYFPIQERDLNRAFPGKSNSTSTKRVAEKIWKNFIEPCDLGIDFHTSTRGRTNMFHIRADLDSDDEAVERLARSFGSNIIINDSGSEGMLRKEAVDSGIPTVTVEMGQAHRFERDQIDRALQGIRSVFAEFGLHSQEAVNWSGWTEVIDGWGEKTWVRAGAGGLVDVKHDVGDVVKEGDKLCTISSPFETEKTHITAPFTGIILGLLKNPVVYPGNPICHFVEPSEQTLKVIKMRQGEI